MISIVLIFKSTVVQLQKTLSLISSYGQNLIRIVWIFKHQNARSQWHHATVSVSWGDYSAGQRAPCIDNNWRDGRVGFWKEQFNKLSLNRKLPFHVSWLRLILQAMLIEVYFVAGLRFWIYYLFAEKLFNVDEHVSNVPPCSEN